MASFALLKLIAYYLGLLKYGEVILGKLFGLLRGTEAYRSFSGFAILYVVLCVIFGGYLLLTYVTSSNFYVTMIL